MPKSRTGIAPGQMPPDPASLVTGTCTVLVGKGYVCGQDSLPGAPFPICGVHAVDAYQHVVEVMTDRALDSVVRVNAVDAGSSRRWNPISEMSDLMNGWPTVVYYLDVGGYIKIGWTGRLIYRMRWYPPSAKLLAIEPCSLKPPGAVVPPDRRTGLGGPSYPRFRAGAAPRADKVPAWRPQVSFGVSADPPMTAPTLSSPELTRSSESTARSWKRCAPVSCLPFPWLMI
ncbi:MAG: hypothetical protein LC749_08795 [Actinobacteria bacterium]|nr:hypothetical protein [Actinomycetota bacterium]